MRVANVINWSQGSCGAIQDRFVFGDRGIEDVLTGPLVFVRGGAGGLRQGVAAGEQRRRQGGEKDKKGPPAGGRKMC